MWLVWVTWIIGWEQSLLAVSVSGQFCVVNIVETGNFP